MLKCFYDSDRYEHYRGGKLRFADNICQDHEWFGRVQERLRACADMALMLETDSQQTLYHVINRAVECDYIITGLDSHMFSFLFASPAGFNGGIIFHCHTKEWAIHT